MEKYYIQDYSYENCFWDNVDFLYSHSKLKFNEYLNIGKLNYNLSHSMIKFSKTLNKIRNIFVPYKENDTSSRGKAIQAFLNFINKIINNLETFAKNLEGIYNKIEEKKSGYESKKEVKLLCKENLEKYESCCKSINSKKNAYYESVDQAIEQHLYDLKKKEKKRSQETINKIEICKKKREEYKQHLLTTEQYRIEYIELQRNILSSEEEFERDCTIELKNYLKQMISFYNDFLKKGEVDDEIIEIVEKIDGTRDNKIFAEENRSIFACPPRIEFIEYNQDLDLYLNFHATKNKLKNKTKEELKEEKNKIATEVKQFLSSNIIIEINNKYKIKFDEIVYNIVNKEITEEDFNYLIEEFQKTYDKFLEWEKENKVEILEFKKVGEVWDNRFNTMQLFLDAFNKLRSRNKELTQKNFEYFTKALDKILTFNDNEDIDYKLCELLLTLSSTFYTVEKVEDKERKKYASEYIRKNPLIQKVWFWVGITKYELSGEILKEKLKEKEKEEKQKEKENSGSKNIFANINLNLNLNYFNINFKKIPFLTKNKKKEDKEDKEDKENKENKEKIKQMVSKNVVAKLMSIGYNLLQFILDSETLNYSIANIFRNFKITKENKQMIISMMNCHIQSEKISHLQINEEMLLNCDKVDYFTNSKENKNENNIINNENKNNNMIGSINES